VEEEAAVEEEAEHTFEEPAAPLAEGAVFQEPAAIQGELTS